MKMKVLFLSLIILLSVGSLPSFNSTSNAMPSGNRVFCEEVTATWCIGCPNTAEALHEIYKSDGSFYYVAMVTDKNEKAADRADDYNPAGYPTSFFDGGYSVVFGGKSGTEPYQNAINECRSRDSPDVDISVEVNWLGGASINVSVTIDSYGSSYQGHLRAYVVEPTSRWNDRDGNPYHFGFLDYAFDEDVSVESSLVKKTVWDGSTAGYSDITRDNIMVIAVLFDSEGHTSYSDPPDNSHPFTAHYVDGVAAASPPEDSPPSVKLVEKPPSLTGYANASFKWEGKDDFTSADNILYSYLLSGYGTGWSQWGHDTEASYDMLADGTYTFMVKAKDSMGQESMTTWKFTVDTSPPSVVSTNPSDNSKGKDPFSPVTITFSFSMNRTSVSHEISINPPIDYTLVWNNDRVLAIYPKDHWKYETTYTITISGNVERDSGQEMGSAYTFSFEVASADTTPPDVLSTYPEDWGTLRNKDNITIRFSEPMETRFFRRAIVVEPWFSYNLKWMENNTLLVIVPKFLPPGDYTVEITTYAADRAGNHLKDNLTIHFEVMTPKVVSTSPRNGEQEVPVSTNVSISFSEDMDKESVENNIYADFHFTYHWDGNTIILKPSDNLEYGKEYMVKIERNATNIYGIKLDKDYSISFFTEEPVPYRDFGKETPSFTFVIFLFAVIISLAMYKKSK